MIRKRCERDIQLFALFFFDHLASRPFGHMHRELFQLYRAAMGKASLHDRPSRRQAIAAPRGAAKSTLKTLIFPIHATLFHHERYIIILSATLKQARQRLASIKAEFSGNAFLKKTFQKELANKGTWSKDSLECNNVRIDVFSAGTELRGISYGPWRPTLVLLDDIEDSRAALNPARRDQLHEWYNEVIENIGDTYSAIEIIGTLLHPDSLLARLLKRPDFDSRTFRSIEQFAERSDLWEEWRALYTNLEDPDRHEEARRYFNARQAEMKRGTKVLWHSKEDYYELMCQMVKQGRAAFFKEKQNEPSVSNEAFFDIARAKRFRIINNSIRMEETRDATNDHKSDTPVEDLIITGFLDAATGKGARRNAGDYAAIVTVGKDTSGHYYVLDIWLRRASPTAQISAIFDLHEKWNYTLFGVETNCFQHLLLQPIQEEGQRRKKESRPWQLPVQEVHHSRNKEMRIATLEPLVTNGWLRFAHDLPDLFWAEIESFPMGEHDDALDALEAAIDLLRTMEAPTHHGEKRKTLSKMNHY